MTADTEKANQIAATAEPPSLNRGGSALAKRLFSATFPVTALIVFGILFVLGFLHYDRQFQALKQRTQVEAELTAAAVARPLWNLDRSIYEPQVRALARDDAFVRAQLFDDRGHIVFRHGSADIDPETTVTVRVPVTGPVQNRDVGSLQLTVTTDELSRALHVELILGLGAFVVLLIGVFVVSKMATHNLVVKPVGRLLEAMGKVQNKDWVYIDYENRDEIGQAMNAFNRMVDGLRSGDEAKQLLRDLKVAQEQLSRQHKDLTKANRLVMESIHYARNIQKGLLPAPNALDDEMDDLVMVWEPLHVVGGDYCWLEFRDGRAVVFLADCTGHGVPGAFMTMVVASALERIIREDGLGSASHILTRLDGLVRARLHRDDRQLGEDDGLDAGLCLWGPKSGQMQFCGAGISLFRRSAGRVTEIKADKVSLGYQSFPLSQPLAERTVIVQPGDEYYLMSDGVTDHLGGSPKRVFGRNRFRQLLEGLGVFPLHGQVGKIHQALDNYRDGEPRRDDLTLVAFRPMAPNAND